MSEKLDTLNAEVAGLRGDVDTLTEAVTAEVAQGAAVVAKLEELKAQIAAGTATDADIDALIAEVQGIRQNLGNAIAQVETIAPESVADEPTT